MDLASYYRQSSVNKSNPVPVPDFETPQEEAEDAQVSYLITKSASSKNPSRFVSISVSSVFNPWFRNPMYDPLINNNGGDELLSGDEFRSGSQDFSHDAKHNVYVKGYPEASPLFLLPYIFSDAFFSVIHFFSRIPQTDISLTWIRGVTLLHRTFLASIRRQKLWVTAFVSHIILACALGFTLGDCSASPYNTASLYGVGTLLLYFLNIQIIYYYFRIHQVLFILVVTPFANLSLIGLSQRTFSRPVFCVHVLVNIVLAAIYHESLKCCCLCYNRLCHD
jgi:small basic protein